ncbi:MAG TPA: hypothetical protein VMZ92_06145, partial [Planctomycetota bacterium]|nr:hypothetical protein [Planctomycetota bacterium]
MKRAVMVLMLGVLVSAAEGAAAEITAGDAKLTTGASRALWERAGVGDVVFSDFACPETGRALDLSGSRAAQMQAKVKALNVDAPCTLAKGRSRLGDETITLENGLAKVVIVPKYGGRIIEISNKATGANIFIDNYQDAAEAPTWEVDRRGRKSVPALLGGWVESVDDGNQDYWNTPHTVETVKAAADEVVVRTRGEVKNSTWGVDGTVTVERTIGLTKGSGLVKLHVKLTNHSGRTEREMCFKPMVKHALGTEPSGDEVWVSSTGYVRRFPRDFKSDCYTTVRVEEKIDTWQGIVDRAEREGVVVLPGGEIGGRMDVFGNAGEGKEHWYTFENTSTLREHVIDGDTIEVDHHYAPVLNFDAVTFANQDVAVEFVPEKVHFAPGEEIKALVGAARLRTTGPEEVTLTPGFSRDGKVLMRGTPVTIPAALLVAEPRAVSFVTPDATVPAPTEPGPVDLDVEVSTGGERIGSFRYRAFLSNATGAFLTLLQPGDDGFGKGLSITGQLVRAKVVVQRSDASGSSGSYELGTVSLPWKTAIEPVKEAFRIVHETDFSKLPKGMLLQSYGMCFPVRLGTDVSEVEVDAHRLQQRYQKQLRVTVGTGGGRDEQWLVDQARGTGGQEYHKAIPYWALSDSADRLPVWRFGGILQMSPTTAWVWKSSNYDSSPMPMVQEVTAAGWVDAYSLLTKSGVLVYMPDMPRNAPKEVIFDGEQGAFTVYFFPPHVPAMSLAKAGTQGTSRAEKWGLGPDRKAR